MDPNIFNELYRKVKLKCMEGWAARMISESFTNVDDQHTPEAESWILKAIDADQRNGMRFLLGRDYAQYYKILKRKGDQFNAREHLTKAIDIFRECGADGWVTRTEEKLASLS
jgi:hypothetical protein